jgi:uncharacterized protein
MPSDRAAELIELLGLQPHPEGGWFRETFRSAARVRPDDGRPARAALTVIDFLLTRGQHSAWHVVASDECWQFVEGQPLQLLTFDATDGTKRALELGPINDHRRSTAVVSAGVWQAARPLGEYVLVQCSVGPGFDFADFQLLRDHPNREQLSVSLGEWTSLI